MTQQKPLSQEELESFRQKLLARRAEIVGDLSGVEAERAQEGGAAPPGAAASDVPTHQADAASDEQIAHDDLQISGHERDMIAEIDAAIERMNRGEYGRCPAGGCAISRRRLEAKPWARYCKAHAEQQGG